MLNKLIKFLFSVMVITTCWYYTTGSYAYANELDVEVTAYELGTAGGGTKTATGMELSGLSREDAMVIAVDPDIIPLGSTVRIEFHDPAVQHYNGVYTALDTGGAIVGHIIDLYMGPDNYDETWDFGRRTATLYILS